MFLERKEGAALLGLISFPAFLRFSFSSAFLYAVGLSRKISDIVLLKPAVLFEQRERLLGFAFFPICIALLLNFLSPFFVVDCMIRRHDCCFLLSTRTYILQQFSRAWDRGEGDVASSFDRNILHVRCMEARLF